MCKYCEDGVQQKTAPFITDFPSWKDTDDEPEYYITYLVHNEDREVWFLDCTKVDETDDEPFESVLSANIEFCPKCGRKLD